MMWLSLGNAAIVPTVWVYTKDFETVRVVERKSDEGIDVFVFGAAVGVEKQHVFKTPDDAAAFRTTLDANLLAKGFVLKWSDNRRRGS